MASRSIKNVVKESVKIRQEARLNNFEVVSIPGPCAAISAIVSSGLPCSKFVFYGFLPKSSKERLIELQHNLFQNQSTSFQAL